MSEDKSRHHKSVIVRKAASWNRRKSEWEERGGFLVSVPKPTVLSTEIATKPIKIHQFLPRVKMCASNPSISTL